MRSRVIARSLGPTLPERSFCPNEESQDGAARDQRGRGPFVDGDTGKVRYCCRPTEDIPSPKCFATKREAAAEAKLAMERAIQRGTIRFISGWSRLRAAA